MKILEILAIARNNIEKEGELFPVIIIESADKKGYIFGLGSFKSNQKIPLMEYLGFALNKKKIIIKKLFFICEGWMYADKTKVSDILPSQHPDRKEIIMVSEWNMMENKKEAVWQVFKKIAEKFVFEAPVIISEEIKKDNEKNKDKAIINKADVRFYLLETLIKGYLYPEQTEESLKGNNMSFNMKEININKK